MRTLVLCVVVGLAVTVSACASRAGAISADIPTSQGNFAMTLVWLSDAPAQSPDANVAVVEVHNTLDRSVAVAFEGRAEADVNVGPNRDSVVRLEPGHYYARGSAAAVASMPPPGYGMNVEQGRRYRLDVTLLFK